MVNKRFKAFSLLEVVMVVAVMIIIALFLFPIALNQLQGNKIDLEVRSIKSNIATQAEYAYAKRDNSSYGIAIFNDHYTLYAGDSLAAATSSDTYNFTSEIRISNINLANGGSEINFVKGSFRPSTTGSFRISSGTVTYLVSINGEGLIIFSKV